MKSVLITGASGGIGFATAKKLIDLGYEDMEEEANRLANIPRDQRTIREEEMMKDEAKRYTPGGYFEKTV